MTKKKKPACAGAPETVIDLGHIAESLRPLAVPIGELVKDPANSRWHGPKNLEGIAASLRVYGQRTPLVVNRRNKNVIEKGNGTLDAAVALGWSHVAVVWVDDDPATAAGYSIADNRIPELAEWDAAALDQLLRSVQTEDEDLAGVFDQLAQDLDLVPAEEKQKPGGDLERKFQVIVDCKDETQQLELLERFDKDGLECRALTL
jgi:hypothetical protein